MPNKMLLLIVIVFITSYNASAQFILEDAFPNLTFNDPVDLQNSGDGSDRIFVVERAGRIKVFPNTSSVSSAKTFLDITDRVASGGEMGLLGLAFHPDYENNGYFYVNYTTSNPRTTRISRFQVSAADPDFADNDSELIILTFNQPYSNHNGGWIGFGPDDGYLYIGVGDGGSGGDPQGNAQNIETILGNILRIDVNNQDTGLQYAIPPDNPFADSSGSVTKEIYAWGMRNPWRNSFDPVTGWLWSADVGQNTWEEIDIIENGKNYGWRCYEGNHSYNTSGCDYPEYIFPIWEYGHGLGCSITGGYVYRGQNVPELTGKYIYADYCSGTVWSLEYDGNTLTDNQTLLTAPGSVTSFGVDECNELYVVTFSPDKIYRFTPTVPIVAPNRLEGVGSITPGTPPRVIIDLWWNDNSDNEDGFIVERKTGHGSFEVIDSTGENVSAYTDWNVIDSTTYMYRVAAYNFTNVSNYNCIDFIVTTPLRIVNAPGNLVASAKDPDEVIVTWIDNDLQEQGFKIERKTGEQGNYSLLDSVLENITTYLDDSVEENTLYYYRVFAFIEQIVSDYSNEDSAQTPNPTGIADFIIPTEFNLNQNYPNPFNPSTLINYQIGNDGFVNLKVFNSLGEEVATLINNLKQAGSYEFNFDGSDLPSGLYIYSLQTTNFVKTKKMILLK